MEEDAYKGGGMSVPFHNLSNACEHFLFSVATNKPLAESEARILAYHCREDMGSRGLLYEFCR